MVPDGTMFVNQAYSAQHQEPFSHQDARLDELAIMPLDLSGSVYPSRGTCVNTEFQDLDGMVIEYSNVESSVISDVVCSRTPCL
jgi:hypothetical protein